jgi:hypothetical protein
MLHLLFCLEDRGTRVFQTLTTIYQTAQWLVLCTNNFSIKAIRILPTRYIYVLRMIITTNSFCFPPGVVCEV